MHCRLFFCVLTIIFCASPLSAATTYVATLLATSDYTNSLARAASNSGQVGFATGPFGTHALLWQDDAANVIDLNPSGTLGSTALAAFGSRQGGLAATAASPKHAYVWSRSAASATDINPSWATTSEINGMTDSNLVGSGQPSGSTLDHAILWGDTPESAIDLNPPGFLMAVALGVDGNSQVGNGESALNTFEHALLWHGSAASLVDLNPTGFSSSNATAVRGNEQVGYATSLGSYPHAIRWAGTADSAVDLNPPGYVESLINSVSAAGKAGWGASASNMPIHALVWHGTATSAVDLDPFLAPLNLNAATSGAYGIADNGVVVGYAAGLTKMYAVMWTPVDVPEPTSLLLGAISLGLASMLRLRRL